MELQSKKEEEAENQKSFHETILRLKQPSVVQLTETELQACDKYVQRMKNANLQRVSTEKKLDLRYVEKRSWRPSTSLAKSKSQTGLKG